MASTTPPRTPFQPRICIIGPGRVGCTLARHHQRSGLAPTLVGRNGGPWQQWAANAGIDHTCGSAELLNQSLGTNFDIILFCVSDPQIAPALKAHGPWLQQIFQQNPSVLVAHTSGHVGLQVFEGLNLAHQQAVAALHPAQPFTNPDGPLPKDIPVTAMLNGDSSSAKALVESWQGRWIELPSQVDRDGYHLAVSLAANHVTEMLARSEQLLRQALGDQSSTSDEDIRHIVHHLSRTAVDAYATRGGEQALTGPVVRGDLAILQAHYAKVPASMRQLQLHEWMAVCELAERSGRLPAASAEQIRKWLRKELSSAAKA